MYNQNSFSSLSDLIAKSKKTQKEIKKHSGVELDLPTPSIDKNIQKLHNHDDKKEQKKPGKYKNDIDKSGGFVVLWRKQFNELKKINFDLYFLFIDLYLSAQWDESVLPFADEPITLQAGEILTSFEKLARQHKTTRQTMATRVKKLKKMGYIKIKITNRFVIIRIINFEKHQKL